MALRGSSNDFRSHRRKLRPEDFAIGSDGLDSLPSDLIDKDTWDSIVSLPDDVSIRTSDHYGSVIKKYWSMWSEWICLVGALQEKAEEPDTSPIAHVALEITDEFQASIYNALVGFYRLAFSSLRNVVEQMTIGLQLNLANDQDAFRFWLRGNQLLFGWAADCVQHNTPVADLERHLMEAVGDNLFRPKASNQSQGFARRLYSELSNFTHGGPAFTNADMWQSNGPIFVSHAFEKWASAFIKTYALAVLETKLAEPNLTALAYGSSSSIRSLFKQATSMIPEPEDGFNILNATPVTLW